jgi:hypothetical protein
MQMFSAYFCFWCGRREDNAQCTTLAVVAWINVEKYLWLHVCTSSFGIIAFPILGKST